MREASKPTISPMCGQNGHGHIYEGRIGRKWPFDGMWCLCRKRRWSWSRHKRLYQRRRPAWRPPQGGI